MALTSPLKNDVDQANRGIDHLHRLYNIYFQGGEDDPPRKERKALEELIDKIKSQLAMTTNSSDKFMANSVLSRFQSIAARWDKHLRGIESGVIRRSKNRE